MKKFLIFIVLCFILGCTYLYREDIVIFLLENFNVTNKEISINKKNEYYRDYNLSYVSLTDNFKVTSKDELINIYYTVINSGVEKFTFYCSSNYPNCINDVLYLANDQTTLSNVNSFVHPYNSFTTIKTEYDTLKKVTLEIEKTYSEEKINEINKVVDEIIEEEIKDEENPTEIIKIVHNYIINTTKYDKERADRNIIKYESNTAYGVLIEHYGLCGGYTDAMAIFLNKYNIPNFKVVSENHIWNAVYIENKWYHLDLTWDDPVLTDGSDTLEYTFFLITTKELEELETNQHIFDKKVFSELNYE